MSTSHESVPAAEGPLAHDARATAEQSYLDRLAEARRGAWERASGARPERVPKRLLVALSHSIERAVASGPIEPPTVVVALFQKLRFFDREREVYRRLAESGAVVVVAFAEEFDPEPPPGVHVVSLRADEPLADEWSVVAVGPQAGTFLVATDQHAFDPAEREPEPGRVFVGRWGYSRAQAGTELARLRFTLGDRLDATVRSTIDELLAEHMPAGGDPAASAGTPGETWATSSLNHMLDGMLTAGAGSRELREQLADAQRAAVARSSATTDPQSGVANPDFLRRWAHPTGANPLPVGLALFDVAELDGEAMRSDERASYFAAHQVAAALSQPLGPVDAVVRLSTREFLIVVPGASTRHLAGICDRIGEQLELASHGYPDIALRARVATVVTRVRPLPVDQLHHALDRLSSDGPSDGGELPVGDRIVVSSTALYADGAEPVPGSVVHDDGTEVDDVAPASASATAPARPDVSADRTTPVVDRTTPAVGRGTPAVDRTGPADRSLPADRPDGVRSGPAVTADHGTSESRSGGRPAPRPGTGTSDRAGPGDPSAPPQPRPEVSPLGHTAGEGGTSPTPGAPRPGRASGAHRSDVGSGTASAESTGDPEYLPQRTAQDALRRLVYGDGQAVGGDPRARSDVFADLSDPPNGRPGPA